MMKNISSGSINRSTIPMNRTIHDDQKNFNKIKSIFKIKSSSLDKSNPVNKDKVHIIDSFFNTLNEIKLLLDDEDSTVAKII